MIVDLFSVKHLYRKPTAMTSNQILTADLIDIIFENRNKEYGAYAIRKAYPGHLKKAVLFMLLSVTVLCILAFAKPSNQNGSVFELPVDTLEVNLEKYVEPEKPKEPERTVKAQPATKPDFVPVIVDKAVIDNPVPDRTDTTEFNPGAEDKPATGPDGAGYIQAKVGDEPNVTAHKPTEPEKPAILNVADIQPEFPGGAEAWRNYLQKMLRVPDELEPGDRRTVQVKFVVNNNGDVTDAVIIKSAGGIFDREVLRVIARMPKWKPGKQNGKPVAVYFTQPVTFTAIED